MLEGSRSGCINHPGVESTVHCKQCGRPVCDACVISARTGRFCSEGCQQKYDAFVQRAEHLEGRTRSATSSRLRSLLSSLVVLAAIIGVVAVVATLYPVPVLSDLVFRARGLLGL